MPTLHLLAIGTCALLTAASAHRPPTRILATAAAHYREDAPAARPIAAVQARIESGAGGVRLLVVVDAEGAGVEPLPGFAGVRGANLRTAEELLRLLREDGLQFHSRGAGGVLPGSLRVLRRGTLPARRFARGQLELDGRTAAEYPLAVEFASVPLPDGEHDSYVVADGLPRLAVRTRVGGDGARIVAIDSLGAPDPLRSER